MPLSFQILPPTIKSGPLGRRYSSVDPPAERGGRRPGTSGRPVMISKRFVAIPAAGLLVAALAWAAGKAE
jgi:hypothetical protein